MFGAFWRFFDVPNPLKAYYITARLQNDLLISDFVVWRLIRHAEGQPLRAVTTVTSLTPVSTPVFLFQHLVFQHLFWPVNSCHLRQIRVPMLKLKPWMEIVSVLCLRHMQ